MIHLLVFETSNTDPSSLGFVVLFINHLGYIHRTILLRRGFACYASVFVLGVSIRGSSCLFVFRFQAI